MAATASGLGGGGGTACKVGGGAAALPLFLPVGAAAGCAPAAAAFAARPRLGGGGGGGGGGGASGFKNLSVSVRERNLPSSNNMKTSCAILGYSGSCGVMYSSVISGNGIFCCTCRHLVKKFLIFCATACCRAVTARNNTIS